MSLDKRGGQYWSYVWINNVRHARSMKTGNKQEATRREVEFRNELDIRRHKNTNINPEMHFAELATRFLGSPTATSFHVDRIKQLLPFFGSTPLNEISKPLATEFGRYRANTHGVAPATIKHDLGVLRHVLFYAVDCGILLLNPLNRLRMPGIRRVRQPVLGLDEEPLLIEAAAPHLRPLIISALDTGMRRGELISQIGEDIDLRRKVLAVTHSKTVGGEQREIPLTSRMVALLSEIPLRGLIFTFRGEKIHKLRRSWSTAVRNAGIRPLQFKHLRHTFNTRLMEAGVISDVREALMGHSAGRPQTTNQIYTHVELPMLRKAIQRLEVWRETQLAEAAAPEFAPAETQEPPPTTQP